MSNLQLTVEKMPANHLGGKKCTSSLITVGYGGLGSLRFSVQMGKCGYERREMSLTKFDLSLSLKFGEGDKQQENKNKQKDDPNRNQESFEISFYYYF